MFDIGEIQRNALDIATVLIAPIFYCAGVGAASLATFYLFHTPTSPTFTHSESANNIIIPPLNSKSVMATRIPPLLDPYLSLPPETSLIVLTSVLGASTNWLVQRYLHSLFLRPADSSSDGNADGAPAVVLVSFMRDFSFWRDGAARLGTDLELLGRRGEFVFVDGLGGGAAGPKTSGMVTLGAASERTPEGVGQVVGRVVDRLREGGKGKVVLVVDQVDLLAATATAEGAGREVREMMLGLREVRFTFALPCAGADFLPAVHPLIFTIQHTHPRMKKVHATIMTLSADEPLVSGQATTLEKEHAALVLSTAHEADMVLSLRLLDTGTAKDVSGVIRITRGGAESERSVGEKEYLYHVGGDGGVRVFERGQ